MQGRNSRYSDLDAGNEEDDYHEGVRPMPYPQGQRMKINSFHGFLTFRATACTPTQINPRGSKIVPIKSIHL